MSTTDDGPAIAYTALRRGTLVRAADGVEVGKVHRVQDNVRERIFDGIVVDTRDGRRFVDAPEVASIAARAVTLTISAAEVADLPIPRSRLAERLDNMTVVRRARRNLRGG